LTLALTGETLTQSLTEKGSTYGVIQQDPPIPCSNRLFDVVDVSVR
jgi:hypothetical protein